MGVVVKVQWMYIHAHRWPLGKHMSAGGRSPMGRSN